MVESSGKLKDICAEVFNMPRYGGQFIRRDDTNFVVADILSVQCYQIYAIQERLPHVKLQIVSSEASTSGFIILVSLGNRQPAAKYHSCVYVGVQLFFTCIFFLYLLSMHVIYAQSLRNASKV